MTKKKRAIDKVRASRDGHEYHEAWVARKSLQLLSPTSTITAIAVEGLSPTDQGSAKVEEVEVADVTLYHGGNTFKDSTRVSVLQFKYSIADRNSPFRATDSKKTITKFADSYNENIKRFGAGAQLKLSFQLVTNRPIFEPLTKAIENLANGRRNRGIALDQEIQFRNASQLSGKRLQQFAKLCEFISYAGSLSNAKQELETALVALSATSDAIASARLGRLRDLVREKAGYAGDSRNLIQQKEVLAALSVGDVAELLPCPTALSDWGETVERVQFSDTIRAIDNLETPLIVHAAGGVGKTVFMSSLYKRFDKSDEVVFFDAFGGGAYRSTDDARHLPRRGLIHIANTLSFRGLCDPILPETTDEQSLIRSFRKRLEQCLEALSKTGTNRKIVLFIDAIDNAEIAANQRRESCFPKILLESLSDQPIKNVRLVASCRSERMPDTYAKYSTIELKPFEKHEATAYLKSRMSKPNTLFIDSAFSRSGGNARVLEYFIKSKAKNFQSHAKIELDALLGKTIEDAILNGTKRGSKKEDLTTFLAGLTMLAPPIKIEDYALANDVDANSIESMISDLAPLIEKSKHGVMFKDEPTETLIFKQFGGKTKDLKKIATNLLAAQEKSIFAARALPNFLYQMGDAERIYTLANDDRFPLAIESTIGKRKIKYSRLRTAAKFAGEQKDFNRLIGFLVELSAISEVDQRGLSYLLDNPEMVVLADDSEAIRRIFDARTAWPGTRHARLGLIHTLFGDLEEAHGHLFDLHEWTEQWLRTGRQSKFRFDEGLKGVDSASIPIFFLAKGEHRRAADYISKWKSWYSFEVGSHFYRYLAILEQRSLVSKSTVEKFHNGLSNAGAITAALSFYDHKNAGRKKLIKRLAGILTTIERTIEFPDRYGSRNDEQFRKCLLSLSFNALNDESKKSAKTIFSSVEQDRPRLHAFGDHHYDDSVSLFVLRSIVRPIVYSKSIQLVDLLPHELHVIGQNIKTADYGAFTKELQRLVSEHLKSSKTGNDRILRNEDRHSIDQFISHRLPKIFNLAKTASELFTSKNKVKSKFEALVSAWETASRYRNGYGIESVDHLAIDVGFELLIFSLNFHGINKAQILDKFIASEVLSELSARNKIKLAQKLALLFPDQELAGLVANKIVEQIEQEDDVTNRANLFAQLAVSLIASSTDEAVAYFKKGLLAVDAIGSGDYRYINELLLFGASARGKELESSEFHSISNICELNMSGEPHKFYWGAYGNSFSKIAGLRGLAQLSRWDDRQKISLEYTLLPYLNALVRDKKIEPKDALALNYLASPVEYRDAGTQEFAESLFSTKQLTPAETREMVRQFRLNNTGTAMKSSIFALAKISKAILGEESPEFFHLSKTIPVNEHLIEKTNHHLNLHSFIQDDKFKISQAAQKTKDEKSALSLLEGYKPRDKDSLDAVLKCFCKLDHAYETRELFFSKLRGKVKFSDRKSYILNLAQVGEHFRFGWKIDELIACKKKWSSSSTSLHEVFKNVGLRLIQLHADEFIGGDYVYVKYLDEISGLSGISVSNLALELVQLCTKHELLVSGAVWLAMASLLNSEAADGVAQAAIKKMVRGESIKLGSLASDGEWKPELYPNGNANDILAELVWKRLGSPDAYDRWRAAHTVRCFAKFGNWDVIGRLVPLIDRRNAGPFQASDHKFFDYNARLWLLVALAKIAVDYPKNIAAYRKFLEPYTKGHHVLFRHFASRALLECAKIDPAFSSLEKDFLKAVNTSLHSTVVDPKKTRMDFYKGRSNSAPAPKFRFSLEYDFHKGDVDSLARVFGIDCWEADDLIAEFAQEIDPTISSMYDKGGRENRRDRDGAVQSYGEQVAWHALQLSAGKLLGTHPTITDSWETWPDWVARNTLTSKDHDWLSDTLDTIPTEVKNILLESRDKTLVLSENPNVLLDLAGIGNSIKESFVVGGSWYSADGIKVEISSALVPKNNARKALEDISNEDPWNLWIPILNDEDESSQYSGASAHNVIPWLARPESYSRLDKFDPYGAIVGLERYRIARDILEFYGIKCEDRYSKYWRDENGKEILRSEAWKGPKVDRSADEYSGLRLTCNTEFLKQVLVDSASSLILVISLRRYQEDNKDTDKFSHSIAVVEVDEDLHFVYLKGRSVANEDP